MTSQESILTSTISRFSRVKILLPFWFHRLAKQNARIHQYSKLNDWLLAMQNKVCMLGKTEQRKENM